MLNCFLLQEDDTSLVIIEQGEGSTAVVQNEQDLKLSSSEHGHLVQQILDSQKELSQDSGKTEIVSQVYVVKLMFEVCHNKRPF